MSADGCRLPGVNFYSWIDKKMPAIKLFQIIQNSEKDVTFNYVQAPQYAYDIGEEILSGLKSRLGDMNYQINMVEDIKRDEKTNKFKSIINKVI